jgi:small subunit ribosomal protein S20
MAKKSSLKKARQAREKSIRNKRVKKAFKTAIKKLELAITEKKDKQVINTLLNNAISLIDKAISKGVIHKSTAGRKKSQIIRKINDYLSGKSKKE